MLNYITKWCVIEKTNNGEEEILNAFTKKEKAEEELKQTLEARKKDMESENPFWYGGTEDWEYFVAERDVGVFTEDENLTHPHPYPSRSWSIIREAYCFN